MSCRNITSLVMNNSNMQTKKCTIIFHFCLLLCVGTVLSCFSISNVNTTDPEAKLVENHCFKHLFACLLCFNCINLLLFVYTLRDDFKYLLVVIDSMLQMQYIEYWINKTPEIFLQQQLDMISSENISWGHSAPDNLLLHETSQNPSRPLDETLSNGRSPTNRDVYLWWLL